MTSTTSQHHRPRSIRPPSLISLLIFFLLTTPLFASHTSPCVHAADSLSPPPPSPPGAQPGSEGGLEQQQPTKTHDSGSSNGGGGKAASITVSAGTTISLTPTPSVITTVTVINGTSTTVTMTLTPSAAQQPFATPTTLPKAIQSILVVQTTTFGKVLPAAGPIDDRIESHFWDKFSPQSIPGRSCANSQQRRSVINIGRVISLFDNMTSLATVLVCLISLIVPAWFLL